jgi:hypothetical protein
VYTICFAIPFVMLLHILTPVLLLFFHWDNNSSSKMNWICYPSNNNVTMDGVLNYILINLHTNMSVISCNGFRSFPSLAVFYSRVV